MIKKLLFIPIFLFAISILFNNCYPTYKVKSIELDTLSYGTHIDVQAKLFTTDNSTIVFPNGFEYNNHYISGSAIISRLKSTYPLNQIVKINTDSVIAMITYEETTSATREFGSFLFGLTATPLTFLGVYCLACPKCCFGSCPTIYSYDGENYNLETELFSECISKQLEDKDLDLLKQKPINDTLRLKITNEALETHYINKFELIVADHPEETEIFPTISDDYLLISGFLPPIKIFDKSGDDVTDLLILDDEKCYRSGVEKVQELKNGPIFDYLNITIPQKATKLILKYRNTLLSTTLLYDVVIGSQGIEALNWTQKMNEDPIYASQFSLIYKTFSGIKLSILEDNNWKEIGFFKDAGPLNWKYLASEIPFNYNKNRMLRLEFIPDNFFIDYIAFDTTGVNISDINLNKINPIAIIDFYGRSRKEIFEYVQENDSDYLKTEPGDSYTVYYYIQKKDQREQTIFISSKGYYNEWIRGGWINNADNSYKFNLFDIMGTLSYLADTWKENSAQLEEDFFNTKILLKEEQ